MTASLEMFLHAMHGGGTLGQEAWDRLGGEQIIKELQKYDPEAKVTETTIGGGGDNPSGEKGYRIDVDLTKLPKSKLGLAGFDLIPTYDNSRLRNPSAVEEDPLYGKVTNSANQLKAPDAPWTKFAPLIVTALAPMAGAAMAGAGLGGAGLTASVTGSGLGGSSSIPGWLAQALKGAPSTARSIANDNFNPMSLLPMAGNAMGLDPRYISTGMTLANLAKQLGGR